MMNEPNDLFEKKLWQEGYKSVMGLDEVGRGCLAGPVVAAGVILNPGTTIEGVTDSKVIKTHARRAELAAEIKNNALCWTIKECSPEEIDEINILRASLMAMEKCVNASDTHPDYLLIDGNKYLPTVIPHQCLIKGDMRSISIGAASILAKVYRDELMHELHDKYPHYGWNTNVGYPTKKHYEGIRSKGITSHHRKSFRLNV